VRAAAPGQHESSNARAARRRPSGRPAAPSRDRAARPLGAMGEARLKERLSVLLGWDPLIIDGVVANIAAARDMGGVAELIEVRSL
jgi:hypothetical protein